MRVPQSCPEIGGKSSARVGGDLMNGWNAKPCVSRQASNAQQPKAFVDPDFAILTFCFGFFGPPAGVDFSAACCLITPVDQNVMNGWYLNTTFPAMPGN